MGRVMSQRGNDWPGWSGVCARLAGAKTGERGLRVLLALVATADAEGRSAATRDTIAEVTGLDTRNVRRTIADLERRGLLMRHDGADHHILLAAPYRPAPSEQTHPGQISPPPRAKLALPPGLNQPSPDVISAGEEGQISPPCTDAPGPN